MEIVSCEAKTKFVNTAYIVSHFGVVFFLSLIRSYLNFGFRFFSSPLQAYLTIVLANLLSGVTSLVQPAEEKQELSADASILSYAPEWVSVK